jgi:hypothetical protein
MTQRIGKWTKSPLRLIAVAGVMLASAAVVWAGGTVLSIGFETPTVTCPNGNVSAAYTISTTAADGASVSETLYLGDPLDNHVFASNSYTILSGTGAGGWTSSGGRTKTHDGTFTAAAVPNGTYTLEVCATQAGSGGNSNKTTCQTETIVVDCNDTVSDNACRLTAFGEVVGNLHISSKATVQINVKGNFGDSANIRITGPNGYDSGDFSISQNGNSCNYHANWKFNESSGADIYGNGGAGDYTVTVTGNGQSLVFVVTLGQ